mmetsp:Transcript_41058/g.92441  ORF Transcript_41058/g.92441 Transcript_41058/m.92441 type:complete len:320 (-) Transcript_41058:215-1174(-)
MVDLSAVFQEVRAIVAPDTSLRRLTAKMLERQGAIRDAYRRVCRTSEGPGIMKWRQFRKLVEVLEVTEHNAMKLWAVITSESATSAPGDDVQAVESAVQIAEISEEAFVWEMLRWIPCDFLSTSGEHLRDHFGSLHACQRALRKAGLPGGHALTAAKFRDALKTVGVEAFDTDAVLSAVRTARGSGQRPAEGENGESWEEGENPAEPLTLDDVVDAMRYARPSRGQGVAPMSQTVAVWQRLQGIGSASSAATCASPWPPLQAPAPVAGSFGKEPGPSRSRSRAFGQGPKRSQAGSRPPSQAASDSSTAFTSVLVRDSTL